MGKDKARRRRQANYEAVHSGLKLPPAPCKKQIDYVPRKARLIRELMEASVQGGQRKNAANKKPTATGKGKDDSLKEPKSKKEQEELKLLEECTKPKTGLRKRQKSYLDEKKKKKKKKQRLDDDGGDNRSFNQQERVPFGEVVDAPPKLPPLKRLPNKDGVSNERFRLQAIEAYRQKRKWGSSRPGSNLPSNPEKIPASVDIEEW